MFTSSMENKKNVISTYTSNYTIKDKEEGVDLDFVFLIGNDRYGETLMQDQYKKNIEECERKNLKYVILGNGKDGVNLSDIEKLTNINANNIVIYAHGNISEEKKQHIINLSGDDDRSITMDIIKDLQDKVNSKNIILCSCFGGKVVDDLKNHTSPILQEGTILFADSAPDEVSFQDDAMTVQHTVIEKTKAGEITSTITLIVDFIKTVTDTFVVAYQLKNEVVSTTFHRKNRILNKIHLEVEKFCEYQLSLYHDLIYKLLINKKSAYLLDKLKKEIPSVDFEEYISKQVAPENFKFLELNMSEDEVEEFRKRSLEKHVHHADIEIVDGLLTHTNILINDKLLFSAIGSAQKSSNDDDKNEADAWSMVGVLLKHRYLKNHPVVMVNRNLEGANFQNAILIDANLDRANLENSNLARANLTRADLRTADLSGSDLTGANMTDTILTNATLNSVKLIGASLSGAQLSGARLAYSDLTGADLNRANLTPGLRGSLTNVILKGADLTGADLEYAFLRESDLSGADLTNAILIGATITDVDFLGADFPGADLTDAKLISVKNLNVDSLVIAKSLMNIQIDIPTLKMMTDDHLIKLKTKIGKDYLAYIQSENNISSLAQELLKIINNENQPLKFGTNTNTYAVIINLGKEKLVELLKPGVFEKLDEQTKENLNLIAQTNVNLMESSFTSFSEAFFKPVSFEKSSASKLSEVVSPRSNPSMSKRSK